MTIEQLNEILKGYGIDILTGWNVPGVAHSDVREMTDEEKDIIYREIYGISKTMAEIADNL